jgi:hypothetical protein
VVSEEEVVWMRYLECSRLRKNEEFSLPAFILFVDYEKAHDSLLRENIWQILRNEGIPTQPLKAILGLYENSKISIKYNGIQTSKPININKGARLYGDYYHIWSIYIRIKL